MQDPHSIGDSLTWVQPHRDPEWAEKIVKEFRVHPITAQVLVARQFKTLEDIHAFLYATLPDLFDPFLMDGMPEATGRVLKALQNHEKILVYGDNDVDGMTGCALLTEFLHLLGANVISYISPRGGEWRDHPLTDAWHFAVSKSCTLIITVDCGITAAEEIAEAVLAGVDVIITDHHEPTHRLPHCVATLNPKLIDSKYPNRELTGVGVAFKLAHAVMTRLVDEKGHKKIDMKRFLDLVALGTVADMGVLLGENRILVRYGLKQLRKTKRIGLSKLISLCEIDGGEITSTDISFKIAPRLNSLGRIDDPQKGVELLLIKNAAEAEKLAQELDLNNLERQKIERLVADDIEKKLANEPELLQKPALVLFSSDWHPGVIAILSARLSKQYNRPTLLLAIQDGMAKGSLRSIKEFPLLCCLKKLGSYLTSYGGHDLAAGLTMDPKYIDEFSEKFIAEAATALSPEDIQGKLYLDAEVPFDQINFDLVDSNRLLEPFGNENPAPIFYTKAKQAWAAKISGKIHLKLFLEQNERILEGLAIQKASWKSLLRGRSEPIEVAFTPQLSSFRRDSIQLLIRDVRL